MSFKIMATITVVIMAAGANCGCSTVPSWGQAQNSYGASQAALRRVPYAPTAPTVEVPGERVVGADPDVDVWFET